MNNKEMHPSFGLLQFNRVSHSGGINLFGSSIQHKDTIVMRLKEAEVDRHLNRDWYHGRNNIVEVEMSYSQFAEVITSMNQGEGVPTTIRYKQGAGTIEECPFVDKKQQFENEFSDKVKESNQKAEQLIKDVEKIFGEKKTIGKGDKEEILGMLTQLKYSIGCNTEFVYKQFNEQMDKTVTEAKGEIEAFMQNKINTITNIALVEYKDELTKLDNPIELNIK